MKNKILIIDDEPDNLEYMARVLEKISEDCDIYQAIDGLMGYDVIEKELPDLVITDWQMPNTGIELIKRMRKVPAYKNIPVIVYSGFVASSENLEIALEAGASDYVNKPIRPMELIARSHVLLRLYGDKNENKYTGSNKIVFNLLKNEIFSVYEEIKKLIPQISNRHTEFEPLKEDLDKAIDDTINGPGSILIPLQRFLLTNSTFDSPPKKVSSINAFLEDILSKLNGIITKKNITIENKFPTQLKVLINDEILNFTLWYVLKECFIKVIENTKIVIKEGKNKSKSTTTISITMNHRSFPKDIMDKIEANWKYADIPNSEETRGCVGLLSTVKCLIIQNKGDIDFLSSKWKGIRLNIQLPTE